VARDFPSGSSAAHPDWPDAVFNVSGLFVYEPLVLGFMKLCETAFDWRAPVEAMHGAPAVLWNGGRISPFPLRVEQWHAEINALYARKVGCFLTFTNHLLEQADLADPHSNALLDVIAQRPDINGVIVASDLLSEYIARRYPALRQVASITKVAIEGGNGNAAYYRRLGERFWRYVVHPDDCHNPELLEQLDRDKAEIIVNENCLRGCAVRARHYDYIARAQRTQQPHVVSAGISATSAPAGIQTAAVAQQVEQSLPECPSIPLTRQIARRRRNCNFTAAEFKAVYDMGFRHFKLQGRRDTVYSFAYDLTRYLLEPDFAAPLIFKTLCSLIRLS